eukprot:3166_1
MIKLSTRHLTQHALSCVKDYNAYCLNNHLLYECSVDVEKLLNYKSKIDNNKSNNKAIKCIKCELYINLKYKLNDIGYYFCGYETCLNNSIFYCGTCCNNLMYKQNIKNNISKFDVISMLNKKKNENNSKQFAIKYVQNQCIRTQITMTFEEKVWKQSRKKMKKTSKDMIIDRIKKQTKEKSDNRFGLSQLNDDIIDLP